jgi:16S rRNA (guanine966-N2)-methyltransferase
MSLRIIGGAYRGFKLKSPKNSQTRPTKSILRQALFNILQTDIEQSFFLDIFAGSGAMGLEALSRGACHVTMIEKNPLAAKIISENISKCGVKDQAELLIKDWKGAFNYLQKKQSSFDFIFLDPPYAMAGVEKSLLLQKLVSLKIVKESSRIFLEEQEGLTSELLPAPLTLIRRRTYGISVLLEFAFV